MEDFNPQLLPKVSSLRQVIPQHCFQRSAFRSSLFIFRDLFFAAIIAIAAVKFIPFQFSLLSILLWATYALIQGTVVIGLWVIGHECGHGAFSTNNLVNDIVGYVLHTSLLVPYFSWQRTHKVHHSKCNHLLDGESHVPNLRRETEWEYDLTFNTFGEDGFVLVQIFNHLVLGFPLYLLFHATGSKRSPVTHEKYTSIQNHFNPFCNQLFPKQLRLKVFLSSFGLICFIGILSYLSALYGFRTVLFMYVGPYFVINAWLVLITWLQHTDPTIPHLGEDEWEWLRGATLTIDRNYPWLIDQLHHRIGTTHVCHHIFHEIPHYHAAEATEAIKKILGKHYRCDSKTIWETMWKLAKQCHYVEQLEGVQYQKSYLKGRKGRDSKQQ